MKLGKHRLLRGLLVVALSCPLWGTGACVQIAEEALIYGFFSAATPLLIDQVESQLGLNGADAGTTAGGDS